MDSDFLSELFYSFDSVNAHHHFLFGKPILEELMDLNTRSSSEQISYDEENPLHKLIVVKMNRVWVDFLLIEVVSNST